MLDPASTNAAKPRRIVWDNVSTVISAAILIGAVLSCLFTAPWAFPSHASVADMQWLILLGVCQLAIPCALAVWSSQALKPHEVAMLALLEVIFGIALAWLGAGETPGPRVLMGGTLVLLALFGNEWWGWRQSR